MAGNYVCTDACTKWISFRESALIVLNCRGLACPGPTENSHMLSLHPGNTHVGVEGVLGAAEGEGVEPFLIISFI